ncbi:unnamed protein product [Cylicocyclus nassatus]|uniref:Uncharacterized protein n=1 Tax=Cylicocyclus nassatus TaxID=53992 RepID=A0AA36HBG7_CYLNA|nr:unnamed protein product [Cylicocyclus nassatus]
MKKGTLSTENSTSGWEVTTCETMKQKEAPQFWFRILSPLYWPGSRAKANMRHPTLIDKSGISFGDDQEKAHALGRFFANVVEKAGDDNRAMSMPWAMARIPESIGWIGCLPCCQRNEVVREEMTKSRLFDQCRNDALVCSQFLHDSNAAAESPSQQNLYFLCIRCSIKVVYRRVGNQLLETKS